MAKIKVAVYDADKLYRERFADYLMSYKAKEIELSVFSGINYFLEAVEEQNYQLLVRGCGYEEVLPNVRTLQVPVLVLREQSFVKESIGIEDAQVSYTSKYQSMDVITHQMYLMTEARRAPKDVVSDIADLSVVGVLSPVRHEMQLLFSLLYAQSMAVQGRVLYLNLMEFSGFSEFFEEEEYDLEDVILQLRESVIRPEAILSCIYEKEEFSYICPFRNPENTKIVSVKDVQALLEFVRKYTDFRVVVIDFGGILEGFAELLESFSKLYCIGRQGRFYEAQVQKFLEYLKQTADEHLFRRVQVIELPHLAKGMTSGRSFLEQLKWSELGDFVRGV